MRETALSALVLLGLVVFGFAFVTAGCRQQSAWHGTVEIVDGVEIVRNPEASMRPEGALVLREELSIGAREGEEVYMFSRPRWLAVDSRGRIYVLDQMKRRVDVFSDTGAHIRSIGGPGQGPGEFQSVFFMDVGPGDELLVGGIFRFSYFGADGTFIRSEDNSVRQYFFGEYLGASGLVITRIVHEEKSSRYEAVLCDRHLEPKLVLASSPVPAGTGKSNVFTSPIRWDTSDGQGVVCGAGEDVYRLRVFDAEGRLVRMIFKDYRPVPVGERDIERMMKMHGFQSRDEITYPETLPPINWVYADEAGRIYVATWQRDHDADLARFNIFDPEGRYLCDAYLPGEILVFRNGRLYTIVQDADGYQYVKRYEMSWR